MAIANASAATTQTRNKLNLFQTSCLSSDKPIYVNDPYLESVITVIDYEKQVRMKKHTIMYIYIDSWNPCCEKSAASKTARRSGQGIAKRQSPAEFWLKRSKRRSIGQFRENLFLFVCDRVWTFNRRVNQMTQHELFLWLRRSIINCRLHITHAFFCYIHIHIYFLSIRLSKVSIHNI